MAFRVCRNPFMVTGLAGFPMSGTAEHVADPIDLRTGPRWAEPLEAHPFEDALAGLRIEGSILLHGHHRPPWAVDVPAAAQLRRLMELPGDVRVVPFHLVLEGSFTLQFAGDAPHELRRGQIVMCADGSSHRMAQGSAARVEAFENVLTSGRWRPGGAGSEPVAANGTELVCGAFALRGGTLNPLLSALPKALIVDTGAPAANPMLAHIVAMIELEVARNDRDSFAAARLLEILFAEALKDHARTGAKRIGWFRALGDPKISRALTRIHASPAGPLSVELLAAEAAISPSRFAARFREVMGQPVMAYATQWRMNMACRMLAQSRAGLAEIAAAVGYQDTAAFSRAFKALLGESPAHWRRGHG